MVDNLLSAQTISSRAEAPVTLRFVKLFLLQPNFFKFVLLLTSNDLSWLSLHSRFVRAVFWLTSNDVSRLLLQLSVVSALFWLTSNDVSWLL